MRIRLKLFLENNPNLSMNDVKKFSEQLNSLYSLINEMTNQEVSYSEISEKDDWIPGAEGKKVLLWTTGGVGNELRDISLLSITRTLFNNFKNQGRYS